MAINKTNKSQQKNTAITIGMFGFLIVVAVVAAIVVSMKTKKTKEPKSPPPEDKFSDSNCRSKCRWRLSDSQCLLELEGHAHRKYDVFRCDENVEGPFTCQGPPVTSGFGMGGCDQPGKCDKNVLQEKGVCNNQAISSHDLRQANFKADGTVDSFDTNSVYHFDMDKNKITADGKTWEFDDTDNKYMKLM